MKRCGVRRLHLTAILVALGAWSQSVSAQAQNAADIAFVRLTEGYWQLWVVGADGADPRQLTTSPVDKHSPRWCTGGEAIQLFAANGESLVYDFAKGLEQPDVELARVMPPGLDGAPLPTTSDPRGFLRNTRAAQETGACDELEPELAEVTVYDGSPPGRAVALTRGRSPNGKVELSFTLIDLGPNDLDGLRHHGKQVADDRVLSQGRVAYVTHEGASTELRYVEAGKAPVTVTGLDGEVRRPSWASKGDYLVFEVELAGVPRIYRWTPGQARPTLLGDGTAPSKHPAVRPTTERTP